MPKQRFCTIRTGSSRTSGAHSNAVVYCNTYGCPSTYCERPNVRFNYYRRLVAYTFLRHIQRHPDDRVALVQFYMLAEKENIDRFGEYPYGHQGAAEHIYIFWNGSLL